MSIFNQLIHRRDADSIKWNRLENLFGSDDVIPMWISDMDFKSPESVLNVMQERVQHGVFGYVDTLPGYFESIASWLKTRHHWSIDPEWIVPNIGVVPTIGMLIRSFTQRHDKIIIQQPVYHLFAHIIQNNNRVVVDNPLELREGRYQINFDDLEIKLKDNAKMFLLCHPHNPVGRVWNREELKKICALCQKYNILLVSDDIHADLIYPGIQSQPVATLADTFQKNLITLMAASKTFNLAGLQSSYAIISNPHLREGLKQEKERLDLVMPNTFGQLALQTAYETGESWLQNLLEYLHDNLKFLKDSLKSTPLKIIDPEATYLIWINCRSLNFRDDQQLKDFFF